ncbi:hypothetical protein ANCCAN_19425 [Ancylostoma caninum]|uniref:SCP domain-containing protein n=1 Tax=Ancylostoma caninum TaxID=29170 RepID=A0A368FVC6_ANCCA|nr:hypothetical protein ANCCAN_19425 [Ancylostoma caninum]
MQAFLFTVFYFAFVAVDGGKLPCRLPANYIATINEFVNNLRTEHQVVELMYDKSMEDEAMREKENSGYAASKGYGVIKFAGKFQDNLDEILKSSLEGESEMIHPGAERYGCWLSLRQEDCNLAVICVINRK